MTESGRRITLASYNVHHWAGSWGEPDPDKAMGVLAEIFPHIAALQEVTFLDEESLQHLAERWLPGVQVICGPTMDKSQARYGNALLTRLPVLDVQKLDISLPNREPRGAVKVVLQASKKASLCVVATHLGLCESERMRQTRSVLQMVDDCKTDVVALMGDFNAWLPASGMLRSIRSRMGRSPAKATFPARLPFLRLDRIWLRPSSCQLASRVHSTPLAKAASDHLPIIAEAGLP